MFAGRKRDEDFDGELISEKQLIRVSTDDLLVAVDTENEQ